MSYFRTPEADNISNGYSQKVPDHIRNPEVLITHFRVLAVHLKPLTPPGRVMFETPTLNQGGVGLHLGFLGSPAPFPPTPGARSSDRERLAPLA